jgi:hypothetical protein
MPRPACLSALVLASLCLLAIQRPIAAAEPMALPPDSAWNTAWQKPAMSADEARAFMKRLAQFVFDSHMKRREDSAQKGMIYEYFDVRRRGEFDQFVQGEALDTMHDGAWFAAAMANAYQATGDPFYKELLTKWQLPFYLKILNHSDTLFTTRRNDARPGAEPWNREHGLQEGEKGFVPYYWDDGGSVSLERRRDKNPLAIRPSVDNLAGKPNPNFLLDGYSQGSSNHLAQDLGIMLEASWMLLHESTADADKQLAAEVAEAAQNLYECRLRHHGPIPMSVAPTALASGNLELMKRSVPGGDDVKLLSPTNHFTQAFWDFKPGLRYSSPGFADNEEYLYYAAVARNLLEKGNATVPRPLALKLIFDAYTERLFFDRYYDDAPRPPGINRFDLYPLSAIDGRLESYRSERKGPSGRPLPIGSRMGPQNMVVCGWAIQLLRRYPGIWNEGKFKQPLPDPTADLERELSGGLRTWEAIFDAYGYIPTSLGRGEPWDHFSDAGGYAHLISAASQYVQNHEPGKKPAP